MGKIRIKKFSFKETDEADQKKGKGKKKTARVPGLKGGERVKVVTGVIIEEEVPEKTPEEKLEKEEPKEKKVKKAKEPKARGKKYKKASQLVDKTKLYSPDEALELVKKTSITSFGGQAEAHLNLAPRFKGVNFSLNFPHSTGKKIIILAFGKGAKKAGADLEGDEKTIEKINRGFKDFTIVLATPEWMAKLAPIAKFLGPRGLMPNPKAGTVTEDLKEAVQKFKSGKTTIKTEKKAPLLHAVIGPVKWPTKKLQENLDALLKAVGETKIKKLTLCASMGPGVKVALNKTKT